MKSIFPNSDIIFRKLVICLILLVITISTYAISVTFSVDLSYQISNGTFHTSTDKVYLRGNFNGWGTMDEMIDQTGSGIYTRTISLNPSSTFDYKYFINSAGAANGGWEGIVGSGSDGNRVLQTNSSNMELPVVFYNNQEALQRSLTITYPNGGENLIVSDSRTITWTSQEIQKVKLEYSTNNGTTWTTIASNLDATVGSYSWTIPNVASTTCKIRISDQGDAAFFDLSNQSFSISSPPVNLDMTMIVNKYNVFKYHPLVWGNPSFSSFNYSFQVISREEFNTQKPLDALPFDVGFVATDGTISICDPTTPAQKAVFADINKAALYYFCQAYLQFYYQTSEMPLLFKVGFAAFESHIDPADVIIKAAVNAYGAPFSSFSVFNNHEDFITKNGFAVAYAFCEFMNIFKNWGYPNVTEMSKTGFNVYSWWFNVNSLEGLLGDFNRYVAACFLETNEHLRVKLYKETENFKFYTRGIDSINYPSFSNTLEAAYLEYTTNFNVKAWEKLTFFSLPECIDAELEGSACGGRLTGGTAWSSGLHTTCAYTTDQVPVFHKMNRHELAHAIQGIMPQGSVTAWLNEGFPSLLSEMPITEQFINSTKNNAVEGLQIATQLYGHRPTYEETKIYPSNPYYDYYTLGLLMNYYIFQKGGYQALKDVQMGDLNGFQKLGYTTCQSFLDDFYFYFDVRIQNIPIVRLLFPTAGSEITSSVVGLQWQPLKPDAKLNVFVSTDGGNLWTKIASETTQTTCSWNSESYAGEFYLKFEVPNSLNVGTTYGPFRKVNVNALQLTYPNGNELFISTDTIQIQWGTTNIPNINVDFSEDNGANWTRIGSNIPTSAGSFNWQVADVISDKCKIRITNSTDSNVSNESNQPFKIVRSNPIGGPYLTDENTVALLHFDNSYKNISNPAVDGFANNSVTFEPSSDVNLVNCVKINNTNTSAFSNIEIPFYNSLTLSNDWTIEFWFKITSWGSGTVEYPYLFIKTGANYFIFLNPSTKNLHAGYDYEGGAEQVFLPENSLSLNKWYHVAFIRNTANTTLKCLLHDSNRQLVASASVKYSASHLPKTNNDPVRLGGFSSGSNCQFNGYADELRISNVAREFRSLTITSPVGGESYIAGNTASVTWSSKDILKVKLEYSSNNGSTWNVIASNIDATAGSYTWNVPNVASANCKIRISDQSETTYFSVSNNTFSISLPPELTLIQPNGGENWHVSSTQNITWTGGGTSKIKIEYSIDNKNTWNTINTNIDALLGTYAWQTPYVVSQTCFVRISNLSDASKTDISAAPFTIIAEESDIISKFAAQSQTFNGTTIPYRIFIPENYSPQTKYPLVLTLHGAGEVGNDNLAQISVWRMATSWADPQNQSKYPCFVIAPQCPANKNWVQSFGGDVDKVAITKELAAVYEIVNKMIGQYAIDTTRLYITGLSMGGYGTWDLIMRYPKKFAAAIPMSAGANANNIGKIFAMPIWNFHGTIDDIISVSQSRTLMNTFKSYGREALYTHCNGTDCTGMTNSAIKQKLDEGVDLIYTEYQNGGHVIWSESYDNPLLFPWVFSKTTASRVVNLTLSSPSGGESLEIGSQHNITWTSDGIAKVKLEYSTDNGLNWNLITSVAAMLGSYSWEVPNTPSDICLLRISDSADPILFDISRQFFSIKNTVGVIDQNSVGCELFSNSPNPFNGTTEIGFYLPADCKVSLKIFDLYGREVATIVLHELTAGRHSFQWDARDLPSGVYLCRIQAGTFMKTRKLILQD